MSRHALVVFDPLKDKSYAATRLGRSVVDFLAWMELGGAADRTLDQYERDLSRACLMYPDIGIEDFTDDDMLHVAKQFKVGERRVRIAPYRSFFKWALRRRMIAMNPCDALPEIKRNSQKVFDLFTEAERAILCGLPSPDGPLLTLMFDAGPRKADCRHLQVKDFRTDPAPGAFAFLSGKGGKDRLVPATLRAAQAINDLVILEGLGPKDHLWYSAQANATYRQIRRHKAIGDGTFARWWTRCLDDAGVRYRNPHLTRHTFATSWLRGGGRLETLSVILGHASIKTTFDLYGHLDMTDVLIDMRLIEDRA
jgi:site-specific recombinase XerD